MSHELSIRANGTVEMAYVGDKPWHGKGNKLEAGLSIEQWVAAAGMDWTIERAPVQYRIEHEGNRIYVKVPNRDVLYRSDTKAALGVVSDGYNPVQPLTVLEFFRDLTTALDYELETAGCLFGGAKIWAAAKTPDSDWVADRRDTMQRYLMLATACDGSMATRAKNTAIRPVCNNTVTAAVNGAGAECKVSHRMVFDEKAVKAELGISTQSFAEMMDQMRTFAATPFTRACAEQATRILFPTTKKDKANPGATVDPLTTFQGQEIMSLFGGKAKGSQFAGVMGTAYGYLNAVTEFVDHKARAHSDDNRMESAWFGRGDDLKSLAIKTIAQVADLEMAA